MKDDLRAAIDALFAPDNGAGPGLVATIIDGEEAYSRVGGLARVEGGLPFTSSTPFHVCSVSKTFTATLIWLLAAEGRLDLETQASAYLPQLAQAGAPFRLTDMLNNVSGLRDDLGLVFLERGRPSDEINRSTLDRLALAQRSLMFVPGDRYSYSNSNFHALGRIIEAVEGRPLPDVMRERILEPLGMAASEYRTETWPPPEGGAVGYRIDNGDHAPIRLKLHEAGAGGLWSTLDDLAKWTAAWAHDDRFGQPGLFRRMTTPPKLNDGTESWYANGFGTGVRNGLRWFGHAGGLAGVSTNVMHLPDRGISLIAASNAPGFDAEAACFQVVDVLDGPARPRVRRVVQGVDFAPWAGVFQTEGGGLTAEIEAIKGGLEVRLMAWPIRLHPAAEDLLVDDETESALHLVGKDSVRLKAGRGSTIALRRVPENGEADPSSFAGRYQSTEVQAVYEVSSDPAGLHLIIDGPLGRNPALRLIQAARDVFQVAQPSGALTGVYLTFGAPDRLTVSMSKAESVPFRRVS